MMNVILFEDEKVTNFYPISRLRTIDEIRTGRWTQKERAFRLFNNKPLSYSLRENYGDEFKVEKDTLFLNSRLKDFCPFRNLTINTCIVNKDGEVLGYRGNKIIEKDKLEGFEVIVKEITLYNFIWDVIADLPERLSEDLTGDSSLGKISSPIGDFVHIRNKKNVYVGNKVELGEGVVLDAEDAPIWIEDDVVIESHSFLKGPVYIGKGSKIKPGCILDVAAIGDVVKLSGEIEESIFQGYSNKQHLGFLGHSFIGEWVNFGAGTTNSDLKNNYSKVRVTLEGKKYETGMQFLGSIVGDHTKAAINTTFNTGTIIEPFCNLFGRNYPPKYLPPFSWWGESLEEHKLGKAIETATRVMKRRNKELDENYKKRIKKLFSETKVLREEIN
jgi:UDP-N-acetylglucosamine diphosphorylase/glucosamine-1-phosphate N-acetyltransferase